MQVVWIPDGRVDVEETLKKNAEMKPTQVLKSMKNFDPRTFSLPALTDELSTRFLKIKKYLIRN